MKAPIVTFALFLLVSPALAVGTPQGGHKVELEYIAYPETTFVDSERRMDVCLVNHGQDAEMIYDGAKDLDQVVVSIPVGSLDDDLTEEPMVLYCVTSEPDWLCLGPELQGDDALLTFRPDGRAQVLAGETLCFQVVMLNVNPEVGLAFLGVDQQIDSKRALPAVNDWMAVFKTDLPVLRHDDLAEVRPDQHHARYTDQEAFQAVLDGDGHGSGLDADTVDGHEGDALEESQEIDDDIAAHAALPAVHHARYTDPEAFQAVLDRDGPGSGLDADTVDGHQGADVEESQEIDDDIAAHASLPEVHHARYTDPEAFQAVLDRDGPGSGLDADTVDGHEGAVLEESQEIDDDIAVHAAIEDAHHPRYTDQEARDAVGPHFSGRHEDLTNVLPSQHHPRYTDAEAFQAVLDRDGPGSGLDADALDGADGASLVQRAGDTMTGELYLPDDGSGGDLRAATRGYAADFEATMRRNLCLVLFEVSRQQWCSDVSMGTGCRWDKVDKVTLDELGCKRIVFLSSEVYDGNLGHREGANQKCQRLADAAGLPGSYMAWISYGDDWGDIAERLTWSRVPYVRVDGAIVALNFLNLVFGPLASPINVDENGVTRAAQSVWTGSTSDGKDDGLYNCAKWQSNSSGDKGHIGSADATDYKWTTHSWTWCNNTYHLYCFQN